MNDNTLARPTHRLLKKPRWVLRQGRRLIRRIRLNLMDAGHCWFWSALWIKHISGRPVWFSDRHGVTLRLYPEDSNLRAVLAGGVHYDDEPVLHLTKSIIRPGMTVFDVGANIGQFTVFAAMLAGGNGRVYSFEPASYTMGRLAENVHHNSSIKDVVFLDCQAVSDHSGYTTLYEFDRSHSAWNSLGSHKMARVIEPIGTEDVPVVTLDEFCSAKAIGKIDLLKIDVEGFEINVLNGARRLIKEGRIQHLIFEISSEPLIGTGYRPEDVLEAVGRMGFNVKYISDVGLLRVDSPGFIIPRFGNFYAAPA